MNRSSATHPRSSVLRVGQTDLEFKNNLVAVCAWCNRARGINNTWHTFNADELFETEARTTHTICNDCKTECLEQVPAPYPSVPRLNFTLA